MFCKYCGSKLIDGAAFCHDCGKATVDAPAPQVSVAPAVQVQPVYVQPAPPAAPAYQVPLYQQPAYTYTFPPMQQVAPAAPAADPAVLEKLEKQALTLGIVGLCLSMLGVPGLVLSCIGSGKASKYKQLTGGLSAKARTGYRLAKAGKIVGIIMTVFWVTFLPALLESDVTYDYDYSDPFEYYDF